jgi:CDP-glucose 4,6-dehydratase
VVTSDKCYENREWVHGYREDEPMGGHDVYSMSKGAAELVTASWRKSFFGPSSGVRVASARAGNVIGGGDWALDRIVPDAIGALEKGAPIGVRSPKSVRPWQHVLEPLGGYLWLAAKLMGADGAKLCEGWNFGPDLHSTVPVAQLADKLIAAWGKGTWQDLSKPDAKHEASLLRLAIEKAHVRLGWSPRWSVDAAVKHTVEWYRAQAAGAKPEALRELSRKQIAEYLLA